MIELIDVLGNDLTVVNAARVSMAKSHDVFDPDSDTRLIKYLARNGHWTPFAQPQIQLRITAPIFVARQWYRSTVGSIRNEVSRRYVDDAPEFHQLAPWRARPDGSIKQGSGGLLPDQTQLLASSIQKNIEIYASSAYTRLLEAGVAPEQARAILPQTMLTQWIETASLAFWARFYNLRSDSHAQREIQEYALLLDHIIRPLFPVSWEALTTGRDSTG